MNKPLISVIVPVYNGQDYVINCIKSIEKQSYSPLEIVVINDGSTDQTQHTLEEYISASKHSNIKLIQMDDRGVSAARNAGIRESRGEFITFVDADDRLFPDTVSKLYDALISHDADVSGCYFTKWADENEWEQQLRTYAADTAMTFPEKCFNRREYLSEQLLNGNSRCWSKLYRRSLFENTSFMEGLTIGEDMLFLVNLLPHVKKWVEIDYKGYGYFQNPKGAMYRPFTMQYLDQIRCWELARKHILEFGLSTSDSQDASKMTRNLIMGIMLVVGKIAGLSKKERPAYKDVITDIHLQLRNEIKNKEAYKMLPFGYKLKISLFTACPSLYLWLYSFH